MACGNQAAEHAPPSSSGPQNARFRFADARIIGRLDKGLKRKLNTGVVLAFIAGLLFLFARPDYRQGEPSLRGRPARDFTFTREGKPAHLSDFRGKVVLLNFWATWCPPCVDETQSLNQLQRRIAPLGGTVLGVSVDEDPTAYENFLKMYNITFPTYRDPSKQISLSYGTTMYPDTYIITRSGRLDRKIVGAQDWTSPDLTAYINSLLNEK
ncbi:MAG TPA: TlpA disulfide reductase family protein [Candidatus Sulfotelmatobacter sp.]|nr:TlpA disulfide reductase family protein [Candidatus Sulfotelmatobacter sp.]